MGNKENMPPKIIRKEGRMKLSICLMSIRKLDRPLTHNVTVGTILQALRECESITLKLDAQIDKDVNLIWNK